MAAARTQLTRRAIASGTSRQSNKHKCFDDSGVESAAKKSKTDTKTEVPRYTKVLCDELHPYYEQLAGEMDEGEVSSFVCHIHFTPHAPDLRSESTHVLVGSYSTHTVFHSQVTKKMRAWHHATVRDAYVGK